ncbi:PrkA family serine protein kinase [Candidatus Kaiserbacteria bacterium RIFCSPHIGHO2_02_FULL_50_50]|uniref:PrkA family serine protein kinase n=1 Tax=Candidatus Kaiserbacteria bacterium RIFCSPHIGHO2_02_FULL_50_50 TaxID=1798492 RepID=A0A1F6DC09_9BACT|nr:MAG: PrkA family serine protein kinase [Candidatus Kaiserbacteria bacterium RIFCSPHIGHO2_02_FULL_50_50]OGG88064.1 MAG: PrkA family serine protein kinase [Candidatus Kaiserbacteria bacterium RIFCSPLOWO2_12_FULL_50_10]
MSTENVLAGRGLSLFSAQNVPMGAMDYLDICKEQPLAFATSAERMLAAIGKPEVIDTLSDSRLSRIFHNQIIHRYPAFSEFYGMEETIMQIVSYFKYAAQGLEEAKQILYLLGPVGGGKSSLAEKLKVLAEEYPIYTLAVEHARKGGVELEISPVFDSPLCLFGKGTADEKFLGSFGISERYLGTIPSPWVLKRAFEFGGDISKFKVVRMKPSQLKQICVCKTEPGDENNQDISSLVGKTDLRKLEEFPQDDTDAYSYSGALCRANQGLLEFVEMFKAPIKVLHPLLTATQEGNYKGTEGLGAIPFKGIVLAHSNEAEWSKFKKNKDNEAFIDRVYMVKVPYCVRFSEEMRIYEKLLRNSELKEAPCAPKTIELLAKFATLSRLVPPENSSLYSKLKVYDGISLKDEDPKAKSHNEYKEASGTEEGMSGFSTRSAYKLLSRLYNFDNSGDVEANPIHLITLLEKHIHQEYGVADSGNLNDTGNKYLSFLNEYLKKEYVEYIGKEIQAAYIESYRDYGQNKFDRYIMYADMWIQGGEFRDRDTGQLLDKDRLDIELSKYEKPAGIANPKDFRHEVVHFVLRWRSEHKTDGNPAFDDYKKLGDVITKNMFSEVKDILPVISFDQKASQEETKKHQDFVSRMVARGYTGKQVRLVCEWWHRNRVSS